jgi:hypothetical protein
MGTSRREEQAPSAMSTQAEEFVCEETVNGGLDIQKIGPQNGANIPTTGTVRVVSVIRRMPGKYADDSEEREVWR